MMLQSALIRWAIGGLVILGLCATIYVFKLKNDSLTLERDNAKAAVAAYKATLTAYQDQYAAQARALNTERGREIARQEKLLKTLNLIGDIDETQNGLVPDSFLSVIGSLYGLDPSASGNKAGR